MPSQPHLLATSQDRGLHLGPRQLQIMRIFWSQGAATVKELRERLAADPPVAYNTLMSLCVVLYKKGLLDRRTQSEATSRRGVAYIYTPTLSEAEYTRRMIGHSLQRYVSSQANPDDQAGLGEELAALGVLDAAGAHHAIVGLLNRAEAAERATALAKAELRQAEECIAALERRNQDAERRIETIHRRAEMLERQMNRTPRPERKPQAPRGIVVEHHDPAGICRVCASSAPPESARRQDGLRVCASESCRREARRRDNVTKQRRYNQRRSASPTR